MSGFLSGRWGAHTKRQTVEECRALDLRLLARRGAFRAGCSGQVSWSRGGKETDVIAYGVRQDGSGLLLTLYYSVTQTGESVQIPVRLETTRPRVGGEHWWGYCPCGRRVLKLYLPPAASRFACRTCHDLTYESVQKHDKRVDTLRKNPAAVRAILDDLEGNLRSGRVLLAIRALG
jgi:hypothetical protein